MGYVIEETAAEVTDGLHEIDSSTAGREASEQFIESFTSGMSSSISSSLSRSIEAGFDIVEYGTDLAEQFNRAFMNTIIEKMVEASALKPMLEQFGGDLFAALQDSVLDPVETQILKTQKDQMILTSKQLGRNVDDAMRALDIEFAQKEAEAAAGREETETFQTISNITRFQANQIVAQLSLHGSYLKTIADTNIKIVELNNAIAESTRTLQLQKITINQSNGLDDKTLADRNLQTQQAQGLQI
jgi:replicative superfamily II helicase